MIKIDNNLLQEIGLGDLPETEKNEMLKHIYKEMEMKEYNGFRILAEKTIFEKGDFIAEEVFRDNLDAMRRFIEQYNTFRIKSHAEIEEKIRSFFTKKKSKVVVWGAGLHTEFLYHLTPLFDVAKISYFVDNDKNKQGKTLRNIPIKSPDIISEEKEKIDALVISSYGSQDAIYAAAISFGVKRENILKLYNKVSAY